MIRIFTSMPYNAGIISLASDDGIEVTTGDGLKITCRIAEVEGLLIKAATEIKRIAKTQT